MSFFGIQNFFALNIKISQYVQKRQKANVKIVIFPIFILAFTGLLQWFRGKELACNAGDTGVQSLS